MLGYRFALVALMLSGASSAQIFSVPPAAPPRDAVAQERAPAALLLPDSAASRQIALDAPTAAEAGRMTAKATRGAPGKPRPKLRRLAVGFARSIPASSQATSLSALSWVDAGDGMRAARIVVQSPSAAGLRLAIALERAPAGLALRFRGSAPGATVYGPIDATSIASTPLYWSPPLDGDSAIVELAVPRAAVLDGAAIRVPMLSHLSIGTAALKQADPLGNIGAAGACESDVACVPAPLRQQAATAINATARILLVDHGYSFLCTVTLLNDSTNSLTPYFYTANHCIDNGDDDPAASQALPAVVTQTFVTYWLFQTNTCGVDDDAHVDFATLSSGATLLARSVDYDWVLTRLNSPPPAGVTYAAWNGSGTVLLGTAADGIHHPEGDLKKFSQGAVPQYDNYDDGSSFIAMLWSHGVTEPGSSGSGLFTLNASTGYLELRGGLFGGDSSCQTPEGLDVYSRLDVALPLLTSY